MLNKIAKLFKLTAGIVLGTVLGLAAFFFLGRIVFNNFYQPYVILSGSMEPIIHTGSVVLVHPQTEYGVGDIVTFKQGNDFVTHRLFQQPSVGQYLTKGDANGDPDPNTISGAEIVGKLSFSVPYLGYLVEWSKTPQGFIALVIIPVTIIVYEELRSVHAEINKIIARLRKRSGEVKKDLVMETKNSPDLNQNRGISKLYVLVPILGCLLFVVAVSAAFFTDQEKSQQNTFSAADNFNQPQSRILGTETQSTPGFTPPAIPGLAKHLVINEIFATPNAFQTLESKFNSQWVEIYNPTGANVDLSHYSIREGVNCDEFLGGLTLPGGGYAILTPAVQSNFNTVWQMPDNTVFVPITGTIGNGIESGDMLELSSVSCDETSDNLDQVTMVNTSEGESYKRAIDGVDTDTDSDWVLTSSPTPGK